MTISKIAGNSSPNTRTDQKIVSVKPQELPTTLLANGILNPTEVEKRACLEKEKDLLKRVSLLQEGEKREGGEAATGCFIVLAMACVMGICIEIRDRS